jgi:hypothetical protein
MLGSGAKLMTVPTLDATWNGGAATKASFKPSRKKRNSDSSMETFWRDGL